MAELSPAFSRVASVKRVRGRRRPNGVLWARRKYERSAMLLELASLKRPLLDEILRKHGFSF